MPRREEQRCGPHQDPTTDLGREVDAQEGQRRVRDGLDQASYQALGLRAQAEVGAAKWDHPRVGLAAGVAGQTVRLKPGADDRRRRGERVAVPASKDCFE